jgi:hypothetical protein
MSWFYSPFKFSKLKEDNGPQVNQNFEEIENVLNGNLEGSNLRASSITEREIGSKILKMSTGTYTGDGTANRVISLQFQPQYVEVLATSDYNIFESIGAGSNCLARWYRTSTGAFAGALTDWQGIVEDGFKCGSATANLSNKSTQNYAYIAIGY